MSRAPVPVGTRVKRSNGRWQVKVAPGEWKWEPRPSRKRKGRVVAFEVDDREWDHLAHLARAWGLPSVSALARALAHGLVQDREQSLAHGLPDRQQPQ